MTTPMVLLINHQDTCETGARTMFVDEFSHVTAGKLGGYPRHAPAPSQGDDIRFSGGLCGTSWGSQRWSRLPWVRANQAAREPKPGRYDQISQYILIYIFVCEYDLYIYIWCFSLLAHRSSVLYIHIMLSICRYDVPGHTHKGF